MNAEAANLLRERKAQVEALGGISAARRHALKHLKLKTVIKESHCSNINQLIFNSNDPSLNNMFATVGKDQVTVYDDSHMGDYIGVIVHFTNTPTEHAAGGEVTTCCWMDATGWTDHPHGDALLAFAGQDTNVSVLSVVETQISYLLKGHTKEVTDLSAGSTKPGLLVSLSKDGNVRVWDAPTETCLASHQTDASCIVLVPDGKSFLTGSRKGAVHCWDLITGNKKVVKFPSGAHTEAIDCMRFLPGQRLATKSVDGRMFISSYPEMEQLATWKVPACNPSFSLSSRCQFGATPDGEFICAGNSNGDVHVYDTAKGTKVTHVSPVKITGAVRACGLSDDCRHLIAVLGSGFIFRYEAFEPEKPVEAAENVSSNLMEES